MPISFNTDFWLIATQALGAIGTIASVLCAIYSYRKAQNNAALLEVKRCVWKIPTICNDINLLLSEPFFAALGNSIADELKKLLEDGQSLEDYSQFLLNDDKSHNYKAQAIYSGLKRCDEVAQIKDLIRSVQDAERTVTLHFPGIGTAIRKLFFYIDRAANRTISSRVFNNSLAAELEDGVENTPFIHAVSDAAATGSSELYFKELAIYITSVAKASLKQNALGQRTIDLSLKMLSLSCNTFGGLELGRLNRISHRDARLIKKIEGNSETHAVEDAMFIFKTYKKFYQEADWEKMIECKGRIIENMESDD